MASEDSRLNQTVSIISLCYLYTLMRFPSFHRQKDSLLSESHHTPLSSEAAVFISLLLPSSKSPFCVCKSEFKFPRAAAAAAVALHVTVQK